MAARDRIYHAVRNALVHDGWTITHDPYRLAHEADVVEVDLEAERTLAAERGGELIAVDIKSFLGQSPLRDFEAALGQFEVYRVALQEHDPDRRLFLAVTTLAHEEVFTRPLVRLVLASRPVPLVVVDLSAEEIVRWIA
jgi:XisH protein